MRPPRLRRNGAARTPTTTGRLGGALRTEVGLRVVFADDDARLRLGDGVVELDPKSVRGGGKHRKHPPQVDVLVGGDASLRGRDGRRLVQATAAQENVALARLETSPGPARPFLAPSVSPTRFNPIGFQRDVARDTLMAHIGSDAGPTTVLQELLRRRTGQVAVPDELPRIVAGPAEPHASTDIYRHLGMIDTPDLHGDACAQATWVVRIAALGVPVLAELSEAARRLLHPELARLVSESTVGDLLDPWRRDRISVLQRGCALANHASAPTWRRLAAQLGLPVAPPTSVSVLLATNRPDALLDAARRFTAFSYPNRELVVGLHGEGFPHDISQRLRDTVEQPLTVVKVGSERNLGQVLNELTTAASGDVVSKMDDDDLYSHTHLLDLLDALRYSDATLVGKGSEFVYLEEIDTTIRRLPNGAESRSRSIGGGTLMISRDDLRSLGGWQQAPRAVDQRLMDDVVAAGGRIHRTHGYGFVLMRGTDGHTWSSDVDYFLRQSVRQWPGLATEEAGIT